MNISRSLSVIVGLTALFPAGCTPHNNPLAAWKGIGSFADNTVPETIKHDARTYFQTLPVVEQTWAEDGSHITYREDGTGQHAAVLEAPHDGEEWTIALIYNHDNRRIKVLRYSTGGYME